jgi:hypothetical protein
MHPTLEVTADSKLSLDEAMKMLTSLNALGRSSEPAFGVRLQADRESEEARTLERTYFTIASHPKSRIPEAVDRIARVLLKALSQRVGPGTIEIGETAVRIAPAANPEEMASLAGQLAGVVSASVTSDPPSAPAWPDPTQDADSFRSFVQAISGLTVEGIVQTSRIEGTDVYSASCSQGGLLLFPEGSGWQLALSPQVAARPIRTWSSVPTPPALVMELILDGLLGAPPPGVQPEFLSVQTDLDTNVERKLFATLEGRVAVHTRQQRADALVETVIELKDRGRIFTLPPVARLTGDFERRELTELPF